MKYIIILAIAFTTFAFACESANAEDSKQHESNPRGAELFIKYCALCHGPDGKKGFNGAKDITASTLLIEERIILIREGKGLMTPYKELLSEEDIRAVAEFSLSLNK